MIKAKILVGDDWKRKDNIWIRGDTFYNGTLNNSDLIYRLNGNFQNDEEILKTIKLLKGHYALIIKSDRYIICVVDIVRSYPLFYSILENQLYISDNPELIFRENNVAIRSLNKYSIAEYLLAGFITGSRTLYEGINQIEPGQLIRIDLSYGMINKVPWFKYFPLREGYLSESEFRREIDDIYINCIRTLVNYANGRPIIIPLSGGNDSRLIAINLKRIGYKPIYTYTYGIPGNYDSQVSKEVARTFGFEWYFIPYSKEKWRLWYQSQEMKEYIEFASRYISVAHIQEWPAISTLLKLYPFLKDGVVVPGHTGDFISGGHLPLDIIELEIRDIKGVINIIKSLHYSLMELKKAADLIDCGEDEISEYMDKFIYESLAGVLIKNEIDALSSSQYWDWKERHCKFIINSIRVYDYLNLHWWLPWWDKEIIEFWQKIPLNFLIHKKLYIQYLEQIQERFKLNFPIKKRFGNLYFYKLVGRIKQNTYINKYLLNFWSNYKYNQMKKERRKEFDYHPLAWYGITDNYEFSKYLSPLCNINTILAIHYLREKGFINK